MNLKLILTLLIIIYSIVKNYYGKTFDAKSLRLENHHSLFKITLQSRLIDVLFIFSFYSILTFTFNFVLLLILLITIFFSILIEKLLFSYFGLDLEEENVKYQSQEVLAMLNTKEKIIISPILDKIILVLLTIIPIYVFFKYPLSSSDSIKYIFIIFFLVRPIYMFILQTVSFLPLIQSKIIDKEKRDIHFIGYSVKMLELVINGALPFFIFKIATNPIYFEKKIIIIYWLILFFCFFILVIVPYFIGFNRNKNYLNSLYTDYKYLLYESLNAFHIPDLAEKKEKISFLNDYIAKDAKLKNLETKWEIIKTCRDKDFLNESYPDKNSNEYYFLLKLYENKEFILRWDFSIFYYTKVHELKKYMTMDNLFDLKDYLQTNSETMEIYLNNYSSKKSTITIVLISIFYTSITFVNEKYANIIIDFFNIF